MKESTRKLIDGFKSENRLMEGPRPMTQTRAADVAAYRARIARTRWAVTRA